MRRIPSTRPVAAGTRPPRHARPTSAIRSRTARPPRGPACAAAAAATRRAGAARAPAARREPAAAPAFRDPFGDSPPPSKTVKRTPEPKPAGRSGGFKDPFSEATPPAHNKSAMVALGESHRQAIERLEQGWQLGGSEAAAPLADDSGGRWRSQSLPLPDPPREGRQERQVRLSIVRIFWRASWRLLIWPAPVDAAAPR